MKVRLGTRGSKLALVQAHAVQRLLTEKEPDLEVEIVTVRTSGDKGDRDRLGAFVREIQEALLEDRVDIAVHCLKDLPTEPVPGLTLGAHLEREDPRDTILTRGEPWETLPGEAVIGTGSVRRTSQLAAHRGDLRFRPLLGNVDTRLRKLQEGEYDAIVLALAGLKRLGVLEAWERSEWGTLRVEPLEPDTMLPAPGQAVLVLECRANDEAALERLAPLDHAPTRVASQAERSYLRRFGGGCSVPVAALAEARDGALTLKGLVAAPDGSRVLRSERNGVFEEAADIGAALAEEMGEQGAFELFRRTPVLQGGTEH